MVRHDDSDLHAFQEADRFLLLFSYSLKKEVLAYTLNGKSIADVLSMTIHQALEFLRIKEVLPRLQAMSDVGPDYLTLGQPLSTLSGGEYQRIKLASELHKQDSIYVMDEPTTGLHLSDIGRLLIIMNRLDHRYGSRGRQQGWHGHL
jgi:excinuclease UvrABC ATPase subunit